jgi:hypothetical protein
MFLSYNCIGLCAQLHINFLHWFPCHFQLLNSHLQLAVNSVLSLYWCIFHRIIALNLVLSIIDKYCIIFCAFSKSLNCLLLAVFSILCTDLFRAVSCKFDLRVTDCLLHHSLTPKVI